MTLSMIGWPRPPLSPAPHEVDDQRNDCDDQQKVNQRACDMESKPTEQPRHKQDNEQDQEHKKLL
jgi:hypothetical protein